MSYRTIRDLDLRGKRVLLRVDFNVPLDADGMTITSDARIRAALPTMRALLDAGGMLVLASHLGRPQGKPNPKMSLMPIAERLGELLGKNVAMASDCIGGEVVQRAQSLTSGDVLMLENLRFHAGEEKNDLNSPARSPAFATPMSMTLSEPPIAPTHPPQASLNTCRQRPPAC